MNKRSLLQSIADNVNKKHPWYISESKYLNYFGKLPKDYLNERIYYDNLLQKVKDFKICQLILSQVKIEIKLSLDQCIEWEINRWEEAKIHNIMPNDIKKLISNL